METIKISDLQKNLYDVIESVRHSRKPVWITDKGKILVKITPDSTLDKNSWLGCMKGRGRIVGDIVSPAESPEVWEVLSE